jgi:O-succinylbenzoic acid--CoA ligase
MTGKTFGLQPGSSALLCMPMQFVAAKMMVIRAMELQLELKVVEPSKTVDTGADFVAMVPLQLENSLVHLDKFRIVLVGGGQISSVLVEKLQSVATEVIETYGMTETLTHVAAKRLNGTNKTDCFAALDGVKFEIDKRDCLVIHAPELNPEQIVTNDIVELLNDTEFKWLGRFDNVINSGGVKIYPEVLEAKLASQLHGRRYFVAGIPDDSLGQKVVLIVEGKAEVEFDSLEKYERPKEVISVEKFVETETGKINRLAVLTHLQ